MKHQNITLSHLRTFVVVAQAGSFVRAAEELSRSQPAVTSSIKQLENHLGLTLFDRTTRRVQTTAEAERFLPTALRLVRDFDLAIQDMTATADCRSGHVSLAVLPSVATHLLPKIVAQFTAKYPEISIHLSDNNARAVQQSVERNEVDFGIASLPSPNRRLAAQALFTDQFHLVCHRSHPLAKSSGPVSWRRLRGHSFLGSGLTSALKMQQDIGAPKFECSTTTSLLAMLKANIGVTALPRLAVPADSELVSIPLVRPTETREICLLTRYDSTLSPAANAMLDTIKRVIPELLKQLDFQS